MSKFSMFNLQIGRNPIFMLLYGQPGSGKTSLACSAAKDGVRLIDVDGGVGRIRPEFVPPTVQARTWRDITEAVAEVKSDPTARVVVVDTMGKLIDLATQAVCGSRPPSIKDWGKINTTIHALNMELRTTGCDVIFIAQMRYVERAGGRVVAMPDVRESQLRDILPDIDCMGFVSMQMDSGAVRRELTFTPTDIVEGKNSLNFPHVLPLPEVAAGADYTAMADLLRAGHEELARREQQQRERGKEVEAKVSEFTTAAKGAVETEDAAGLSALVTDAQQIADAYTRTQVLRAIQGEATRGGYTYNRQTKSYEKSNK